MSILKKLSDVLKEVFWLKPSSKKKSPKTKKKAPLKKSKKIVKKPLNKPKIQFKASKPKPQVIVSKPSPSKTAKPKAQAKTKAVHIDPKLVRVGEMTHYFDRIKVCVVKITQGTILIGDKLTIVGKKSKFVQKVWSMQIESQDVKVAKKGQLIGIKIDKPIVVGDIVYK